MTLAGGTFQAEGPLGLALAAAPIEARIALPDRREQPLRVPASFSVCDGARLVLGQTTVGARTYLAVRGGWQTTPLLGSRSTEQSLRAGERIPAASSRVLSRHVTDPPWQEAAAVPFRIVAGPDARTNPELNAAFWASRRFRVGPRHDRKGLRLEGDPFAVISDPERLSAPVLPGALQVAGGQLIVLGAACGTMGGYPHVAHVITADLDRVGQLRVGDLIGFECVTIDQARAILVDARNRQRVLVGRVGLMSQDG